MDDKFNITISLKCCYCGTTLTGEQDKEYKSDEIINCSSCNKDNIYGSVFDIAQAQGHKEIQKKAIDYVREHLNKTINDINKKN